MLRQIIEKEFPLRYPPKTGHLVIVEANHERGNDIEFLTKVWERTKRLNLLNDAADTEQARDFPKHCHAIYVEANSGMTEELRNVEKVSCAAAQIENLLGTREVELKLANSPDVDSDPTLEIEIFWPVCAGIGDFVALANLTETNRIDRFDDPFFIQREPTGSEQPERMFPRADQAPAIYKLAYFMLKSHLKKDHTL